MSHKKIYFNQVVFSYFFKNMLITLLFLVSTIPVALAMNNGESATAVLPEMTSLSLKSGPYLGVQIGYDSYRISYSGTNNLDGSASSSSINSVGFVSGLFAGYGQYFNNLYYLGGEFFVNDSSATATTTFTMPGIGSVSDQYHINWSSGFSLLPGLKLNDKSLAYLRLGYNWVNMKIEESGSNASGIQTYSVNVFNVSNGFMYGLGIESLIYQKWSVRGEFDHVNYSSFTPKGSGFKFSPTDNQFLLGLIYHF